ncbi:MAG TPA: polysaccharide deacetylase family protein [Acidimicrobiia bacterium]|nr:polysaccharide deacetylase family protein [Acidimicrobiia bacterium]
MQGVRGARAGGRGATSRTPTRRRRRRNITLAVAAVAIALASGAVAVALVGSGSSQPQAAPLADQSATTTTVAPTTTTTTAPFPTVPPGTVVTNGPRDRHAVAITFDSNLTDAMIQELDQHRVASFANVAVIDELDQLQVPATLFLAGKWIERYPDLTRRLAADPLFELGSHSYEHRAYHQPCYGLGTLPVAQMAADVNRSEELLHQFTGRPTPYFRFPGGCYDTTALQATAGTGITVIQYDLASGDAFGTSVRAIVNNVVTNAQNGSIIVMHITGGNTAPLTAYALPEVVTGLRQKGFSLVRVSDLLGPPPAP